MHKKIISRYWFLILILITNLLLRFYKLSELFYFTYDESVFTFIGKRMVINGHIPLIGGVTPFHVHLGPYFYWLSGLILGIGGLNPLVFGLISLVISCTTLLLCFVLARKIYGLRTAYLASLIYCFSAGINLFDRHYWGLLFDPLASLLVILGLLGIWQKRYYWSIVLALVMAFAFHTDPTTWILLPLIIFVLFKNQVKFRGNKLLKTGLLIFLLSFLPLVIFDLRHNFVNSMGIVKYFNEVGQTTAVSAKRLVDSVIFTPKILSRIIYVKSPADLAKEYSYCQTYAREKLSDVPALLWIMTLIVLIWAMFVPYKTEEEKAFQLIYKILVLVFIFGIVFYNGLLGRPVFEHYISLLFPVFIIILAGFFTRFIKNRAFIALLSVFFIIINLRTVLLFTNSLGYSHQESAVNWIIANTKGDFALDSLSSCFKYNGVRYLFYLLGKEPAKSYVDADFFWLYDLLPSPTHPPQVAVIIHKDYFYNKLNIDKLNKYRDNKIKSAKFGDLEVIIADNTKGIFYDF